MGTMKGKLEKGASSSGAAHRLRLQVDDVEDLLTTPGGSSVGGSSPMASALPSPTREAAMAVETERRLLSAPSDTALSGSRTQREPMAKVPSGDSGFELDRRLVSGAASVLHAGEDVRSSSNITVVEGEGYVMTRDNSGVQIRRQWKPAGRRAMQQEGGEQGLFNQGLLKPHRSRLGVRHHVVPADARDIARMREGKNLVRERMLETPRLEMRKDALSSSVVRHGNVVYDVEYLRDDTELWHRRAPRRASVLERMLCCAV